MIHTQFKQSQSMCRRVRDGFTLVETMVSAIILIMALISAVSFLVWLARSSDAMQDMSIASTLAQEIAESMRTNTYDTVMNGSDAIGNYTRTWTVTDMATMKRIDVAVKWDSYTGVERSVEVATFVRP